MRYDLVLRNGIVLDGTGSPPFRADLGIVRDTIASIGDLSSEPSEASVDLSGLFVAPGFIDIHNHSDVSILENPEAANYVMQGVTTIVTGNCGFSPAPLGERNRDLVESYRGVYRAAISWSSFGEYLDVIEKAGISLNVAPLVGHSAIRSYVIGFEDRAPSERELEEMVELAGEAMRCGAFGISTGLIYAPSMFAGLEEIVALARAASRHGGIYATHMRNEGAGLIDSVIEAIEVGLRSGAGVEISHLKASGRSAWGKVSLALGLISEYASRGFDVSADAYPYTASSTSLLAALPRSFREGSRAEILKRLGDPGGLETLKRALGEGLMEGRHLSWEDVAIALSPSHKEFEGMRLSRVAEKMGLDPVETVARLLVDDGLGTRVILFGMSEEDVERVISHPLVAIGSDGSVTREGLGKPHPRAYGTFPRVIARYVRERKLISLEEAVRKMTSLPARKLGLWDRGLIRPGFKADLVAFDYTRIEDTATYENPHSNPRGILWVLVNGKVVVENGVARKGVEAGRVLRKKKTCSS